MRKMWRFVPFLFAVAMGASVTSPGDRWSQEPSTPTEMIRSNGYTAEEHSFDNSDGYTLTLHRIPYGKSHSCQNEINLSSSCRRPVVFIQHGLASSSADFVITGVEHALAYQMADAGYDVWLGNFRGNTYSRRHVRMSPDSRNFWQFSWHELGTVDLPEMIDFVLAHTNQQALHYIGHSQGTTTFLVMTASYPKYNDKVRSAHLMAPVAFMQNARSPVVRALSRFPTTGSQVPSFLEDREFMATDDIISQANQMACRARVLQSTVCNNALFMLAGYDSDQLNSTMIPEILKRYPAGCSMRQVLHYVQEVNSGKFCKYDHGMAKNMEKYGSVKPPSYELGKVSAPVHLYYSHNDWLAAVEDVEKLKDKLPNVRSSHLIQTRPRWNHIDFLWGNDARSVVYQRILGNMRRQEQENEETNEDRD